MQESPAEDLQEEKEVDDMAVIKNNELKEMTPKAAQAKIEELEKAILELQGEGKKEKIRPIKKAIAKLKTIAAQPVKEEKPKA